MSRGRALTIKDANYIRTHCKYMTCAEIAKAIGRNYDTVLQFCMRENLPCKAAKRGRPRTRDAMPRKRDKYPTQVIKDTEDHLKVQRPPAVYTNSGSPYGIADELHRNPNSFTQSQ